MTNMFDEWYRAGRPETGGPPSEADIQYVGAALPGLRRAYMRGTSNFYVQSDVKAEVAEIRERIERATPSGGWEILSEYRAAMKAAGLK